MAAFPNLVLTNAGIALQNKVQGGVTLELTNIQMGSGQLNGQPIGPLTALISSNATVPIQGGQAIGQNTYQVEGFFTNADLSAGFWWREIGIFANDPDNGEILYAYANAGDAGDYIPTVTDQRIEKYIYFSMALANATTVNVTIPQTDTFVLKTEVGQPNGVAGLDENGAVPIKQGGTGETTVQAALAALGAGVRPNLLDNAIFVGGGLNGKLPVNQRAKTEYSNGYGIDRWYSVYGNTMEILQDGVKFQYVDNNYVAWQVLSNQLSYGNTITVSALLTNGILLTASGTLSPELDDIGTPAYNEYSVHYVLSSNHLNITGFDSSKYITIQAVKLELGENQTLAHQDADGVWHLLPQPESDYTTQLLRCQRYFQLYSSADVRPAKAIDCRPVMRIDPTPGTLQIDEQTYYYNSAEL